MIEVGLWCCSLLVTASLFFFALLFLFMAWPRHRQQQGLHQQIPISVLICAHNEEENLRRFLPEILTQDYVAADGRPAFEVVVVNDASSDASTQLLATMAQEYAHLQVVTVAPDEVRVFPGKKFALSKAIAAAHHEQLVCTDADCRPAGKKWLQTMAAPLAEGKEIVAGYGGFFEEKGLLNAFIRHETLNTFFQYSAFARVGFPYMAVGRNLATTKTAFLKARNHPAWKLLPSGDDDLLVQTVATSRNMALADQPEAFCFSESKKTLHDYLAQKRRHVSTAKFYTGRSRILPGLYALSQGCWWLLLLLAIGFRMAGVIWLFLILPMLLLCCVQFTLSRKMQARSSMLSWLLFALGWLLYNAVLAPYMLWKTKQGWT
ncbi:MAG: glycosyltransferase [Bacteroidetes bacterium]|nr:glycosyltransferase [Bacteroidota bacterium]